MRRLLLTVLCILGFCPPAYALETSELASLGEALFFDTNLSANRTQACATCHNPAGAFIDTRQNRTAGAVSLGDDGQSLGDRNAPTLSYAALVPPFGYDEAGELAGGLFYDGRAADLADQAGEPFTNPDEMALASPDDVVTRVRENPAHEERLKRLFGAEVFATTGSAFDAIRSSIAAFEKTEQFAPFDSKYDRYLRGEIELDRQEEIGRKLFFSQLFNCHTCHLVDIREHRAKETFTNHRFHNIGVPVNRVARDLNGLGASHRDRGLLDHPAVDDSAMAGKFRVPTLRNVAVTPPYMHNGVFEDLATVILFYNKFILSNAESQINPETGRSWGKTEYPDTVDHDLLQQGQPISALQVDALVAFLETLTDRQFEHLLPR